MESESLDIVVEARENENRLILLSKPLSTARGKAQEARFSAGYRAIRN